MSFIILAALVSASESGSLRQAAEKLHLSQPALSRSIRELENEAGRQTSRAHAPWGRADGLRQSGDPAQQNRRFRAQTGEGRHRAFCGPPRAAILRLAQRRSAAFSLLPAVFGAAQEIAAAAPGFRHRWNGQQPFQQLRQGGFRFVFGALTKISTPMSSAPMSCSTIAWSWWPGGSSSRQNAPGEDEWEKPSGFFPAATIRARTAFEEKFYARSGKGAAKHDRQHSFVTMLTIISAQNRSPWHRAASIFSVARPPTGLHVLDLGLKFPVSRPASYGAPAARLRPSRNLPSTNCANAARQVAS